MKKLIFGFLALVALAHAQWTASPSTAYPALNTWLDKGTTGATGTTAPGSCVTGKDFYTTTGGLMKWCVAGAFVTVQASLGFTPLNPASNLSDLGNAATARTNLGLGTAATQASSAFESAIAGGSTAQYWRGDKSWQTLNTTAVPEGSNQYFTTLRAQSALSGMYELPLTFNAPLSRSGNAISCSTCGGGGGSSGNPLVLTRTSGSVLTLGATCSTSLPCTIAGVGTPFAISSPITLPLVSGDGNVSVYAATDGNIYMLTPSSGISVSCTTGCSAVTSLPTNIATTLLGKWNATAGSWDANPLQQLAVTVPARFIEGSNVTIAQSGNDVTISAATGGGTTYDPMDMTTFFKQTTWAMLDHATGTLSGDNWSSDSNCFMSGYPADPGGVSGGQFQTANCWVYYGGEGGTTANDTDPGFRDFLSGSTPLPSNLKLRIYRHSGTGDVYYGWTDKRRAPNSNKFIGIYHNNAATKFQCVVISGGSILGSVDISASDNNAHTFSVAVSTANTVTCGVDAITANLWSATFPSFGDVFAVAGTPSGSTLFWAFEARIQIKGLAR